MRAMSKRQLQRQVSRSVHLRPVSILLQGHRLKTPRHLLRQYRSVERSRTLLTSQSTKKSRNGKTGRRWYACYLVRSKISATAENITTLWYSNVFSQSFEEVLTPVTDSGNMGGLVPVSPLDQTLDDMLIALPNYIDVRVRYIEIQLTKRW